MKTNEDLGNVSTIRFPYPDSSTTEMVIVAYQHVDKWYLQSHKHVIDEKGSHRIPLGLHSEHDHEFSISCRMEAADRLREHGIEIEV